jgi:hypothetical protein
VPDDYPNDQAEWLVSRWLIVWPLSTTRKVAAQVSEGTCPILESGYDASQWDLWDGEGKGDADSGLESQKSASIIRKIE